MTLVSFPGAPSEDAPTGARSRPGFVLTGWHVLIGFLIFFGIDVAVNTVFMVSAYRTFPGETSLTPYEDGVAYNATLQRRRAQATLGWSLAAGADAAGGVRVEARGPGGAPLEGLRVTAHLERPATQQGQRDLALTAIAPGVYAARTTALPGAWDLDVKVRDAAGHEAEAERRIAP